MKTIYNISLVFLLCVFGHRSFANRQLSPNNAFIFQSGIVEFAIYPDGNFDFDIPSILPRYSDQPTSYNGGYNYERFIQYDNYGAVIQIENTPVYYDNYGRISRAGTIPVYYNMNGLVEYIGGMYVSYDHSGYPIYIEGDINQWNKGGYQNCRNTFVFPTRQTIALRDTPYRRGYIPSRYSYQTFRSRYIPNYDTPRQHVIMHRNTFQDRLYHNAVAATAYSLMRGKRKNNRRAATVVNDCNASTKPSKTVIIEKEVPVVQNQHHIQGTNNAPQRDYSGNRTRDRSRYQTGVSRVTKGTTQILHEKKYQNRMSTPQSRDTSKREVKTYHRSRNR